MNLRIQTHRGELGPEEAERPLVCRVTPDERPPALVVATVVVGEHLHPLEYGISVDQSGAVVGPLLRRDAGARVAEHRMLDVGVCRAELARVEPLRPALVGRPHRPVMLACITDEEVGGPEIGGCEHLDRLGSLGVEVERGAVGDVARLGVEHEVRDVHAHRHPGAELHVLEPGTREDLRRDHEVGSGGLRLILSHAS